MHLLILMICNRIKTIGIIVYTIKMPMCILYLVDNLDRLIIIVAIDYGAKLTLSARLTICVV